MPSPVQIGASSLGPEPEKVVPSPD